MEKVEKTLPYHKTRSFFSAHGRVVEMFDALSHLLHMTISLYSRAALYLLQVINNCLAQQ